MNFIPSDNTLKRHCITEIRNAQQANFAAMLFATQPVPVPVKQSIASVVLPLVGFLFIVALFFV